MKLKNLPTGNYTYISSTYTAILDGGGWCCENCGRVIANLVTVQHEGGRQYIIGQDCAKTLFSDTINKNIDRTIKAEKRRQEQAPILEAKAKKQAALKEFLSETATAGINNNNCNERWARLKYNELLEAAEARHGIHITYKRDIY